MPGEQFVLMNSARWLPAPDSDAAVDERGIGAYIHKHCVRDVNRNVPVHFHGRNQSLCPDSLNIAGTRQLCKSFLVNFGFRGVGYSEHSL